MLGSVSESPGLHGQSSHYGMKPSLNLNGIPKYEDDTMYSATLEALSLEADEMALTPMQRSLIEKLNLPELEGYPVPPVILNSLNIERIDELVKKTYQDNFCSFSDVTILDEDGRNSTISSPTAGTSGTSLHSIEQIDISTRKKLLHNLLVNFVIEMTTGVPMRQLTAMKDTVRVFVRLSDDIHRLIVDLKTGSVLEFPVADILSVSILQKKSTPRLMKRRTRKISISSEDVMKNTPDISEDQKNIEYPINCDSEQHSLNGVNRTNREDKESTSDSETRKTGVIVVLDFATKKVAFAFENGTVAATFQLCISLLAKRGRAQVNRSAWEALTDNFYTPRAAQSFLRHIATSRKPSEEFSSFDGPSEDSVKHNGLLARISSGLSWVLPDLCCYSRQNI